MKRTGEHYIWERKDEVKHKEEGEENDVWRLKEDKVL